MTRLLIARHGNTFEPGDPPRRVGGRTDIPLATKGHAQARALGMYLLKNDMRPDVIYSGTLRRTVQTARGAMSVPGRDVPLHQTEFLNEIDYGPDENRREDDVRARIGVQALSAWDEKGMPPSGWDVDPAQIIQNWQDFGEKILREYPGKTILAVTSNGIARFAPCLTGDFEGFCAGNKLKIATGALCGLVHDGESEGWTVVFWNIRPPLE